MYGVHLESTKVPEEAPERETSLSYSSLEFSIQIQLSWIKTVRKVPRHTFDRTSDTEGTANLIAAQRGALSR